MAQIKKRKLSGSTDGRQIKIVATATPGTLVHTATSLTAAGTWDEIWLYLTNTTPTDVQVQVELGGTTSPDDRLVVTIPGASGRVLVLDGAILQNAAVVRAFAGTTNVINASGFVNQVTD
jgi:hypothetical protein